MQRKFIFENKMAPFGWNLASDWYIVSRNACERQITLIQYEREQEFVSTSGNSYEWNINDFQLNIKNEQRKGTTFNPSTISSSIYLCAFWFILSRFVPIFSIRPHAYLVLLCLSIVWYRFGYYTIKTIRDQHKIYSILTKTRWRKTCKIS